MDEVEVEISGLELSLEVAEKIAKTIALIVSEDNVKAIAWWNDDTYEHDPVFGYEDDEEEDAFYEWVKKRASLVVSIDRVYYFYF